MMKKFKDLLMKKAKEGKFLSEKDKMAKKEVLGEIQNMMKGMMGEDLKKITVASPTAEGLKAGLEKAEEVVEAKEEMEDEEYSNEDKIRMLEEKLAMLKG